MALEILSHRGYWKCEHEKNQISAFQRSFSLSFGTETDVRDICGELVISHDPPVGEVLAVEDIFCEYAVKKCLLPLALNIKADGLQNSLKKLLKKYSIDNYFVFDMSIPDTLGYLNAEMKVFARQSEFERDPPFYDRVVGIWLDSFVDDWYSENDIAAHVELRKKVCIVSPELHRRSHRKQWERLRRMKVLETGQVMLCTDFPEEAREFFHE